MMKQSLGNAVFLVFEGLDGTGKTSCAKATAELLGAHYMTTPTQALRSYRDKIIASFNGNQVAAQMFYLATVLAASDEVKSHLAAGQSVVLDRYFLSTQVYAEFRGSMLDVDEAVGKLLLPAHWTVFLEAPLSVRQTRTLARGTTAADSETLTAKANAELLCGYERRAHHPITGRWLRVDSSTAGIHEIARLISARIGSQEDAVV